MIFFKILWLALVTFIARRVNKDKLQNPNPRPSIEAWDKDFSFTVNAKIKATSSSAIA